MSIYQEQGYKSREDYLNSLVDEYDCDYNVVYSLADMLGEIEDFDGLVIALEDM